MMSPEQQRQFMKMQQQGYQPQYVSEGQFPIVQQKKKYAKSDSGRSDKSSKSGKSKKSKRQSKQFKQQDMLVKLETTDPTKVPGDKLVNLDIANANNVKGSSASSTSANPSSRSRSKSIDWDGATVVNTPSPKSGGADNAFFQKQSVDEEDERPLAQTLQAIKEIDASPAPTVPAPPSQMQQQQPLMKQPPALAPIAQQQPMPMPQQMPQHSPPQQQMMMVQKPTAPVPSAPAPVFQKTVNNSQSQVPQQADGRVIAQIKPIGPKRVSRPVSWSAAPPEFIQQPLVQIRHRPRDSSLGSLEAYQAQAQQRRMSMAVPHVTPPVRSQQPRRATEPHLRFQKQSPDQQQRKLKKRNFLQKLFDYLFNYEPKEVREMKRQEAAVATRSARRQEIKSQVIDPRSLARQFNANLTLLELDTDTDFSFNFDIDAMIEHFSAEIALVDPETFPSLPEGEAVELTRKVTMVKKLTIIRKLTVKRAQKDSKVGEMSDAQYESLLHQIYNCENEKELAFLDEAN